MGSVVLAGATSGSTTITPTDAVTATVTLPSTGGTLQTSGAGFTTNGVAYASSTSALTTGSALTWSGTLLSATTNVNSNANVLSLINSNTAAGGCGVGIIGYSSNGSNSLGIIQFGGAGSLGGNLDFSTANSSGTNTLNMRLTSSGNLLLGTTTALGGSRLDVKSSTTGLATFTSSDANGTAYYVTGSSGKLSHYATYQTSAVNCYHSWWVTDSSGNQTQAMTLDVSGNLLVGATSAADSTVRTQSGSSSKDGRIQGWLSTSNGGGHGVLQLGSANTGTGTECSIQLVSGATALGNSPTSANGTQYVWGMGLGPYSVGGNVFAICNDSYAVNVKLNYNSSSWISVSDERVKNITANIENANQIIANWRTVYYTLKSDETNSVKIGLIAQDVQKTLPEVVDVPTKEYDDNNNLIPLGVHYSEVVPVLVKAIQELSTLITAQQSTIQSLTERITALEGART